MFLLVAFNKNQQDRFKTYTRSPERVSSQNERRQVRMDLIRSHGIFDRILSTSLIRLRIRYLSFHSSPETHSPRDLSKDQLAEANFLMMILPLRALWTAENGSDLALPTKHSQVAASFITQQIHFNQTVDSDFSSCLGSLSFFWKFGWEYLSWKFGFWMVLGRNSHLLSFP